LVELFLRGSAEGWDPEEKVGTRAGVITALVLGALLALENGENSLAGKGMAGPRTQSESGTASDG
jgi:hypothetical protein